MREWKKWHVVLMVLIMFLGVISVATAGSRTLTVGPGGQYTSIQAAINAASAGDTIVIAPGTYRENLASWKDMEIRKSLILRGAGSGLTVIELTEGKTNGVEIRGTNLSVTIEGITFTRRPEATYASNFGLRVAETASSFTNLTLRDVEVAYARGSNVFLGTNGSFENVIIEDSCFHHAGSWGFYVQGTINSMTVKDSDFMYNGQVSAVHGIGFDLAGPRNYANITVTGGSFNHNTHTGINMRNVSNSVFKDLSANSNNQFGIKVSQWGVGKTQNIEFENVIAVNNGMDGISIQPETEDAIEDILITGSTLASNGRNGLNLVYIYTGSNNPEMKNISITHSAIFGNRSHGVRVWSWWVWMPITEVFNATNNWWGDKNGPSHSSNPDGSGNRVSDNVIFNPWLKVPPGVVEATVQIDPGTLNLNARGQWIAANINLPEGYNASDIPVDSVQLIYNGKEVNASWGELQNNVLMVKFDRSSVVEILETGEAVEINIVGEINDTSFEGSYTIRVISPGNANRRN